MHADPNLQHDLMQIRAAISLLEQTRAYLSLPMPNSDPAYWKARLKTALDTRSHDALADQLAAELCRRIDRMEHAASIKH
ncbi:hypothetical protein [Trinickia soli]|uniref:Uncharacterized protein n=1 Tax=Trinickia soli TaxID=380675 RepID=A0A2N7VV11_9BURK|nr:hypothetical protein [Trinickia soli]PMS20998.1 hypothetical protein C0Z19_19085 [Trinickia soli]CAB3665516.1 hypothetical protein LMG24076_01674 [Trinickia soli]